MVINYKQVVFDVIDCIYTINIQKKLFWHHLFDHFVYDNIFLTSGEIRVCNYCQKIVQAYLNDDLENSIEALNEDIKAVEQGYRYEINSSSGSLSKSGGKNLNESGYTMKVEIF